MAASIHLVSLWIVSITTLAAQVNWVPRLSEAKKLAAEGDKFIVVDVSADWCPPCQRMAREVYPDPQFQEFTRSQVFMLVDAYKDPEGQRLSNRFRVKSFPTILVLDAQGREIDRLTGGRGTQGLIESLSRIFEHPMPAKELNRAAEDAPGDAELQRRAGERAFERDDFKRARKYLGRALELIESDPDRVQLLTLHAQAAFEDGETEEALQSFAALEALAPQVLEVANFRLMRARMRVAAGRHEEALEDIERLLRSGEERDEARKLLSRLPKELRRSEKEFEKSLRDGEKLLEQGKPSEALLVAQEAVDAAPDSARAHRLLARVHAGLHLKSAERRDHHFTQAVRHFHFATRLDPDDHLTWIEGKVLFGASPVKLRPDNAKAAKKYSKAEDLIAKQQYRKAAELYLQVMEMEPSFSRAVLHLGDCFFQNGQMEQALKAYTMAAQISPLDPSTHRFAADALLKLGRVDEARQRLMTSLLADPSYPWAWRDLRGMHGSQGLERHLNLIPVDLLLPQPDDYDRLISAMDAATAPAWRAYLDCKIQWQNELYRSRFGGEVYRYSAAEEIDCLGRLTAIWGELRLADPELSNPELDFLRQVSLASQTEAFVFLELFSELLRPEFEAWKRRRPKSAQRYLKDFVYSRPLESLRQGYNNRAIRAYNQGVKSHDSDPERAADHYREALAHEPYMESALINLGILLLQEGDFQAAEEILHRRLQLNPASDEVLESLSEIHYQTGRFESAVKYLQQALEHTQDAAARQRREQNLEYLKSRLPHNRPR